MVDNYTQSLYQHQALLYAIDFFTQSFNLSDIANYSLDFSNEMLTLESSALFLKEGNYYNLIKSKNMDLKTYKIKESTKLKNIPTLHGHIIKSKFSNFLKEEDIDKLKPRIIIPLSIKDKLYGFIISTGKAIGDFNKKDYLIADTLMRLANMSLENTKYLTEMEEKNKELDDKVYNLFFINQTSKSLLSELDPESLYTLCTDIIGEVTCSKITTFGLYSDLRDKIVLKNYRDISSYDQYYSEIELNTRQYKEDKIILNYKNDLKLIKKYFANWQEFEKYQTEYIILLVKEEIHGFVTISEPVNNKKYDKMMFELIESLMSNIYIAITNARLFRKVDEQRKLIKRKYNLLKKLNQLIKQVNICDDINEMVNVVGQILNVGFGLKKYLITVKDTGNYKIIEKGGFQSEVSVLQTNSAWEAINTNGIYYQLSDADYYKYLEIDLIEDIGKSNCLIISPIKINQTLPDEENQLGYILIFETPESLGEEEVLLIDTISNSIAPIIRSIKKVKNLENNYIQDPEKRLVDKVKAMIYQKQEYHIDFLIYFKKILKKPFEKINLDKYRNLNYVYLDNYLFVLSQKELDGDFDGCFSVKSIDDLKEQIKNIRLVL